MFYKGMSRYLRLESSAFSEHFALILLFKEIGELFQFEEIMYGLTPLAFNRTYKLQRIWYVAEHETNILHGTCPLE